MTCEDGDPLIAKLVLIDPSATDAAHLVRSYQVEHHFYQNCIATVQAAGLAIPDLVEVEQDPSHGVFCFVMRDLKIGYPEHPGLTLTTLCLSLTLTLNQGSLAQ